MRAIFLIVHYRLMNPRFFLQNDKGDGERYYFFELFTIIPLLDARQAWEVKKRKVRELRIRHETLSNRSLITYH